MAEGHEYAFEITLFAVVRVTAEDEAAAREILAEVTDCANVMFVEDRTLVKNVFEATLNDEPVLVEVDGEAVAERDEPEERQAGYLTEEAWNALEPVAWGSAVGQRVMHKSGWLGHVVGWQRTQYPFGLPAEERACCNFDGIASKMLVAIDDVRLATADDLEIPPKPRPFPAIGYIGPALYEDGSPVKIIEWRRWIDPMNEETVVAAVCVFEDGRRLQLAPSSLTVHT